MLVGVAAMADGAPGVQAAAAPTTLPVTATPATATPATTVLPAATTTVFVCTNTYKVHGGDSWSLIAAEASVSAAQLYSLNGASGATALYPGDSVCLPSGATVVTTAAPVVTAAKPATPAKPAKTHHVAAPVTTAYTSKPSS